MMTINDHKYNKRWLKNHKYSTYIVVNYLQTKMALYDFYFLQFIMYSYNQ